MHFRERAVVLKNLVPVLDYRLPHHVPRVRAEPYDELEHLGLADEVLPLVVHLEYEDFWKFPRVSARGLLVEPLLEVLLRVLPDEEVVLAVREFRYGLVREIVRRLVDELFEGFQGVFLADFVHVLDLVEVGRDFRDKNRLYSRHVLQRVVDLDLLVVLLDEVAELVPEVVVVARLAERLYSVVWLVDEPVEEVR